MDLEKETHQPSELPMEVCMTAVCVDAAQDDAHLCCCCAAVIAKSEHHKLTKLLMGTVVLQRRVLTLLIMPHHELRSRLHGHCSAGAAVFFSLDVPTNQVY
jgi:hypothetical protein